MTTVRSASRQIVDAATSWPGVEAVEGSRGELSLRLGRRELGHLHGDRALHIGFPREVWERLHAEGRIDYHPVFPGKPGYGARRLAGEDDVRDAIALLRLNYDRAVARHGLPDGATIARAAPIAGLHASPPEVLPFAAALRIRAFLLERERGNLLLYSVRGLEPGAGWIAAAGGVTRQYLGHGHEAMFASPGLRAPVFVHAADRAAVAGALPVRATFSRRHRLDADFEVIPMPGHTPGSTAYLWDNGTQRVLFTADTLYVDGGEWVAAVLPSSDRAAMLDSLALLRDLEFDVLVPWAARAGEPFYALTDPADARARIGAVIERLRAGGDR